jgi:hypothetical protein
LKKYLGFVALALFVALLGCGGGGGGGGGSTDGTSGGGTNADPNSTIVGRILNRVTAAPVAGVVVRFYNASNVQVGTATSRANGYFDAILGVDAVKFDLDNNSFSHSATGYNSAFRYNSQWYFPSIDPCRTPLPSITPGVQKNLPSTLGLSPSSEPPPPPVPNGCQP